MKKIIIFFLLIFILSYCSNFNNNFSLRDYFKGEYCSYTNSSLNNSSFNLGFCYLNKNNYCLNSNLLGESIVTSNLEVGTAIKTLKANVIKTEYLDNGTTVIYAYSPLISKTVKLFNTKINLQFAITNNTTVIGWPLILGSF